MSTSTWTETHLGMREARGLSPHVPVENQHVEPLSLDFVHDELFGWTAVYGDNDVTYTVPAQITPEGVTEARTITRRDDDRKTIVRSDTGAFLGVFKNTYEIHQYGEWLVRNLSKIVSDTDLKIAGAGLGARGARAWLVIEAPETLKGPEGLDYRPNIIAGTSLDGSISTTFRAGIQLPVCSNQITGFLSGKANAMKLRHRAGAVDKLQSVQEALGIMASVGDSFTQTADQLLRTPVTSAEFTRFVELAIPVTEKPGAGRTQALRKHDELRALYTTDARVTPWTGTAFGVLQAMNTWVNHMARIATTNNRLTRTMDQAVDGKLERADQTTIATLEQALRRELVSA